MALADNVTIIYISRLLCGIAGAGCFYVAPVYVAEISDKQIRGTLCSLFSIICSIGVFLEFFIAEYMDFRHAAIFVVIVSIIFVVGFWFMPESPLYLISKRRFEEAENAFKFLRGQQSSEELSDAHLEDFNLLKQIAEGSEKSESQWKVFKQHISQPGTIKGIFIAIVVAQFPIMSGSYVLVAYNQGIFKAANVSFLSVFWSSLAFAFIQIVAGICTAKYVDKIGRRIILISSSFATALCLAIFGVYMLLSTRTSMDLTSVSWIALVSLLVQIFVCCIGMVPVPNFYLTEILDQKVRNSRFDEIMLNL